MGPEECHKSDKRVGAPLLRRVERMGVVQHGQGLWGDLIATFQYIKVAFKKVGEKLSSRVCGDGTRGSSSKLKEGRCRLVVRKKFFRDEDG